MVPQKISDWSPVGTFEVAPVGSEAGDHWEKNHRREIGAELERGGAWLSRSAPPPLKNINRTRVEHKGDLVG